MTPDLRYPNNTEFDPQTQWNTFKAQLSYALVYPDSEDPDVNDLPSRTNFYQATPINITSEKFSERLYDMTGNEILGDEMTPVKVRSVKETIVEEGNLIEGLYEEIGVGESIEIKPLMVFSIDSGSASAMVVVIEIEKDFLAIQVYPVKGGNEPQASVLKRLQKYIDYRNKIGRKKTVDELLAIPGITRGSDLKNH